MAFSMRKSKFRHVFGKPLKKDECYDSIRITKSTWDSTYCAVNPKYVAVITEAAGGGAFLVLPLSKSGRVERDAPLVAGHKAAVLDIAWCPHNDDVIASASEDCTVKVWQIPEGGLITNLTEPVVDLIAHQRRVGLVVWHPSAQNILLSAGSDNKIFIWNVGTGEAYVEIEVPDIIHSVSFNYNGSKFVCTCKDKVMRVINARTGDVITEGKPHQGAKPAQAVYLKDGKIFTTGFSRMSERQYALWNENDFEKAETIEEIDQSNGIMFPFYDPDTSMVYLLGKGDSVVRYFEVTDESPFVHYLNMYQSKDAMRGFGFMPKRGVNVNTCEVARIYKLHNSGLCEIIPFIVPRKSELFQEDLYPDCAGDVAAVSADDWINGTDADPVKISLKEGFVSNAPEASVVRKSNILDKKPIGTPARKSAVDATPRSTPAPKATPAPAAAAPVTPAPAAAPASASAVADLPPNVDVKKMQTEIAELRKRVDEQNSIILSFEERLAALEGNNEDDN